jgi:hypothetical protein
LLACGSANQQARLLEPEIGLYQEPISRFLLQYPGQISVPFQMEVRNPSGEPVKLKRLELLTVGSGAYQVRRLPMSFNEVIGPGQTRVIPFTSWAYAQGGRTGANEPVTIRGIAYFEGPDGMFRKVFTQHLSQMGNE